MPEKPTYIRLADLQGFHRLANDATIGVTDVVEALHDTIARVPGVPRKAPGGRTRGVTGLVYRSVRGVTRLVGVGIDVLLDAFAPLAGDTQSSPQREAVLAALNGLWGDHMVASRNPLAIAMRLRANGMPLTIDREALLAAVPGAGRRVLVLVHGLCLDDLQWLREGHDHGAALARDLGYTPIYLHYNSGLHISINGREFGDLMEALIRAWPQPIEQLTIIAHSMGGLVARSACHYAALAGHAWPSRLDHLVFLGTPHLGAPLERAGAFADFLLEICPYTAPFARLGKARSAGIKDLRYGYLRDDDWRANPAHAKAHVPEPMPLPEGVRCYAVAASRQKGRGSPTAKVRGDGLVPVASALGRHRDASLRLAMPESHRWVGYQMGHFDLLSRGDVYTRIVRWLADARANGLRARCARRPLRR
jgi:hypothetical protein